MSKQKFCIRCGKKLHPSDWEILKYHNQMPICDVCVIKYSNITTNNKSSTDNKSY